MNIELTSEDVNHVRSRAQAITNGDLVDVTKAAHVYGFRCPVAFTRASWARCVAVSPAAQRAGEDERARLADALWMLGIACKRALDTLEVVFAMRCVTTSDRASLVQLRAVARDENGVPAITIMLPDEES